MLPILLPYNEPSAVEIISMIGESGSAKEVIMAVQEAAEKLKDSLDNDLEEPEIDEGGARFLKRHSRHEQLILLVELCTRGDYHSRDYVVTCSYNLSCSHSEAEASPQIRSGNCQTIVRRTHGCSRPC